MLDRSTRTAILELSRKGRAVRWIAKNLKHSRQAVQKVIDSEHEEVPELVRDDQLLEYLDTIRELHVRCEGNWVRVHEELLKQNKDIQVAYSTLTAFGRRHQIGVRPKERAGQYLFAPGQEMQHDTSPHDVLVGGKMRRLQCASLVLCFSRMQYSQVYPSFTRFWCKVFLKDALVYFQAVAARCTIDNTHVIVLRGTGADAVMTAEMEAYGKQFGTEFIAHEKGDANRSACVERPFDFIERNFYPGRTFTGIADVNAQMAVWCDKNNHSYKPKLKAVPADLFAVEHPALLPLPPYIPEVYELHERIVDIEGFISVHANRYSVPETLLGRTLQVHETKSQIQVFSGHKLVCEHQRQETGMQTRVVLDGHHPPKERKNSGPVPSPMEQTLCQASPHLSAMVQVLRKHPKVQPARAIRKLYALWRDYPDEPVQGAIQEALTYGLVDLDRIETMVLERVKGDFFRQPPDDSDL